MKLDILALGAHPDDVELGCGGTLLIHAGMGKKTGIADLTRGELATRGTPDIRNTEAKAAAKILGVSVRENLGFADGFFINDKTHQLELIKVIRKYKPEIVIAPAKTDRHPDHLRASELVADACFLSGLPKIKTNQNGKKQSAWRPRLVIHYIQFRSLKPDFVVDISATYDKKMEAVKAYTSQFYNPRSNEPETIISSPGFIDMISSRSKETGMQIGVEHGEGFTMNRYHGIKDLFDLI